MKSGGREMAEGLGENRNARPAIRIDKGSK